MGRNLITANDTEYFYLKSDAIKASLFVVLYFEMSVFLNRFVTEYKQCCDRCHNAHPEQAIFPYSVSTCKRHYKRWCICNFIQTVIKEPDVLIAFIIFSRTIIHVSICICFCLCHLDRYMHNDCFLRMECTDSVLISVI